MRPVRITQVLVGLATSAFLAFGGCGDSASGLSTDGAALDAPASTSTDVPTVADVGGTLEPFAVGCFVATTGLCVAEPGRRWARRMPGRTCLRRVHPSVRRGLR